MKKVIKILLIEDNDGDARLIKTMLFDLDQGRLDDEVQFRLETVQKLSAGLKRLKESPFDIVLLDLFLPDSSGLNTFQKVMADTPELPVIVLSGLDDKKLALQAVRDGAQDYLVKGHVDAHLLPRAIRYALERKKVETEKHHIQDQLYQAQKMDAIGVLTGGIAHDFNNLMTAILGFTDVLMMKIPAESPLFPALKQIRIASGSASDLTRQMLFFSRKQPMEFTSLNVNKLVEQLLKLLYRIIGEDISITMNLNREIWQINADRGTLEQVLMNLAINAREAMQEGGKLTISTANITLNNTYAKNHPEARPGKFVRLSVSDTGTGMDPETLNHIFEPFYSTKGPANRNGLGLSVVYGVIKEHKGWIQVDSIPAEGTAFHIYLPVESTKREKPVKDTLISANHNGSGKRILLVEDAEGVREFASFALKENGYIIDAAATASEALSLFEKEKGAYDLAISDIILPDENGIKLINHLHEMKPGLPVLFCSGYTDQKLNWETIRERNYKFLQKPYSYSDLLRAVQSAIHPVH